MDYIKIFIIFLSLFISLSNCLEEGMHSFNITEIDSKDLGCNEREGRFRFWIKGNLVSETSSLYMLYLFMESPPNAQATCIPFFNAEKKFYCRINIVTDPLTDKSVRLPKNGPYSSYYIFPNWEEFINKNGNVIAENIDCKPIITNTFIYSSFEKNESTLIIKGKWLDNSLLPDIAMQAKIIVNNSTKYGVYCTYDKGKATEFNCPVNKEDTINLEDQLFTGSDNNVYKLEKPKNSSCIIALNLTLFLLGILFL